tara:strand:+ start:64 stop:2211 length:2148 start_codon:yes stop_codon:yes gene_type:complete
MTIERKLLGTTPVSGEVLPEAVSFDGTSDYLSRSSDLTGNADGKTYTFSCWIYQPRNSSNALPAARPLSNNSGRFNIFGSSGSAAAHKFVLRGSNTSGTIILNASTSNEISGFGWVHLLVSIDLANTSNRYIYINDELDSGVTWTTYTNENIDFTDTIWRVNTTGGQQARLANIFLDYTYRDLSVTANRRLFIDADGKPSSTIPSNPILYLPMTDAATAGSNSGTGGDFTVNGVLATAERGPNQDNCSASDLDGQYDYLNKTGGLTNGADSKQWTISANLRYTSADTSSPSNNKYILYLLGYNIALKYYANAAGSSASGNRIELNMYGPSGDVIDTIRTSYGATGYDRNFSLQISGDQTNFNKLKIMLNGEALAVESIVAQYNRPVGFAGTGLSFIGSISATANYFQGALGEIWVHNTYTDLATDNPFWDSDANRPNSVRKVIADTSVTPLIALPLMGNDAGNNLGTGGDFTVNSGPYTGARGGSEFWARGAKGNGSTGYLSRAGVGMSNSKTVSGLICFNVPSGQSGTDYLFATRQSSGYLPYFKIMHTASLIYLDGANTDESRIFQMNFGYQPATSYVLIFCIDMSDQNKSYVSLNGTVSANYTTYTDAAFGFSEAAETSIMSLDNTAHSAANISSFYLTTDYIDFTQEANRNKFVDQLGYPKNLTQQIEDGDIPNPNIYMKFDPTVSFGTNSGTGGNFTVNGTVTAGSDAKT